MCDIITSASIIIPVYNTVNYIEKCLSSICSQTFENFEAVIVDDGSTDGSGLICDAFAKKDSRLKVFHTPNRGVAATRNFALSKCKGEFLTFVDSDDWVEPDFLESLINKTKSETSEIAICDFYIEKNNSTSTHSHSQASKLSMNLSEMILRNYVHPGLWHKLFIKSIIDKHQIHFSDYGYYEDFYFVMCYLHYISKISFVIKPLYHYRIHDKSLANNPDSLKRYEMYVKFIQNMKALESIISWKHKDDIKMLYYEKINTQKIRLAFFLEKRQDLLRKALSYYPESVEYIERMSFIGKAIYWATKYNFYLPISILFLKIKLFNQK